MNYLEMIQQIFEVCIIPLLGVLTLYITSLIKKKMNEMADDSKNELEKKYIKLLSETITDCVIATNQTYVDTLKAEGKFDAKAQKKAYKMTYEAVIGILSDDAKKYLTEAFGDLETYITNKIESEVNENK